MQPSMKMPTLKLGDVSSTPDPQPSNESAGKPKMSFGLGLGLDLTKAKQVQAQSLVLAEEKKQHARETAQQEKAVQMNQAVGSLNVGGLLGNNQGQSSNENRQRPSPDPEVNNSPFQTSSDR